ncbi:hypothetical protein [Streptomyces sp. NPDC102437]|uniref:hypothetical protein n=1 Tax=Streptomyces sp. NPDC102437 TaxID=3366175 RepID=UPI0038049982
MHHGVHALVLDLKRVSQQWARGLPTVTYRSNIADIHDVLVGLRTKLKHLSTTSTGTVAPTICPG